MASKRVFRACKLQGLSLRADALQHLTNELENEPSLELDDVIYALKNSIDRTKLATSVVSLEALQSALDTLLAVSEENEFERIQIFDAFTTPRVHYNAHTNAYELRSDTDRKLHADAKARVQLLRDRFEIVERRVRRNKLFAPPAIATSSNADYIELSRIESLLGVTGVKRVVGMLGQDERKRLYIEDLSSRVYIDLSNASYTNGLFTINCVVLVEGEVVDDILHVQTMGFPPPETKALTVDVMSGLDPLGVEVSTQQKAQIAKLEVNDHHATFIVLSDVHLDDPRVLSHLDKLFQGLEGLQPALFVLMGDFLSAPIGTGADSNSLQDLTDGLDELGSIIQKYPKLAQSSQFVLVPGPNDPGSTAAFPRHPLPTVCTRGLTGKVPTITCTTNPCRIRYYTQDILIFRDNLQQRMERHTVVPVLPDEETEMEVDGESTARPPVDISKHVVKTVVDQGHLCPLPLSACPIDWDYDSFMRLFPLPDVLILGDSTDQFQLGYSDVAVFHPGSFHVDFSFVLYRPSTKATEFSILVDAIINFSEGQFIQVQSIFSMVWVRQAIIDREDELQNRMHRQRGIQRVAQMHQLSRSRVLTPDEDLEQARVIAESIERAEHLCFLTRPAVPPQYTDKGKIDTSRRARPQSSQPSMTSSAHSTKSREPRRTASSIHPSKQTKWSKMLARGPRFKDKSLQRLEEETDNLLYYAVGSSTDKKRKRLNLKS